MALPTTVLTVLPLVPAIAAARTRGGSGGNSTATDTHLDAPPLAVGNIIVYSLLIFATTVQFMFVARALCRRSTRLPASGVSIALLAVGISYSFGLAFVVARYTFDSMGHRNLFDILHLQVASIVFFDLKDLAMYAAVALVLRHCYLSGTPSTRILLGFTSATCFLLIAMLAFIASNTGVFEAAARSRESGQISFQEANSRLTTSDNLFYVFVAFDVVTVLFLATSAFLVKGRTKNDMIMTWILFGIVPLLLVYAIARIAFAVYATRFPLSDFSTTTDPDFFTTDLVLRLDLATTIVFGVLYLAIMSILVRLLLRSPLWKPQPPSETPCVENPPPQMNSVPQPLPQQQYQENPDGDVPVYSAQNPSALTASEKSRILAAIPAALPM